jgi:hypothetical protein
MEPSPKILGNFVTEAVARRLIPDEKSSDFSEANELE